ncbi:IQ domain-containing protein IQM2-like [Papaver somniferum]|uniref:IQ domain-containing protein IQM2-like n=1 Tax=Papaver somniferum TaxID=3469 RepID=UPI000E6FF066|nr:IQ domain-containing protein IQM2-like [Papaver somniferum]
MGISFSCPGADYDVLNEGFDGVIVRSISFHGDDVKTALRSVSFNGRDSKPTILKSVGSGKMIFEGSVSLKSNDMETMISLKSSPSDIENNVLVKPVNKDVSIPFSKSDSLTTNKISWSPELDSGHPKHEAALKLQKVYKSFRTRRKLADCAVLVEQGWWKLLDFAELKRSSVSFFEDEQHETAISRWSRARTRAAKVGKGLSKDDKAQKLALQHWLEAIDPRHRYGHNLHFYYVTWLRCDSRQPFFYWLDIGDGREINLVDKCPRSRLQQQCIKYLGPIERKNYEVIVDDGKFMYKQSGELLNTSEASDDAKWIFVLSTSKNLYVGQKKKGTFQHSSFLAGGATSAAGRLVVENGILKAVWPHSGHYRPTEQNFQEFVSFLTEHNVDLTDVKRISIDEDESIKTSQHGNISLRSNSSEEDLTKTEEETNSDELNEEEKTDSDKQETDTEPHKPKSKRSQRFSEKLTTLEIPNRVNLFVASEISLSQRSCNRFSMGSPLVGYETADESLEDDDEDYAVPTRKLIESDEEGEEPQEQEQKEIIPKKSILRRINSKKVLESYQLGKQLSFKWTTGAGPRIGCVRDYPSGLQFRALEHVNLSPRPGGKSSLSSPKPSTPTIFWRDAMTTPTRTTPPVTPTISNFR